MNSEHWCGLMMLGIYTISALGMWFFLSRRNKKENKKLDNDDKGLIFIPVINTIGLFAELWDLILG